MDQFEITVRNTFIHICAKGTATKKDGDHTGTNSSGVHRCNSAPGRFLSKEIEIAEDVCLGSDESGDHATGHDMSQHTSTPAVLSTRWSDVSTAADSDFEAEHSSTSTPKHRDRQGETGNQSTLASTDTKVVLEAQGSTTPPGTAPGFRKNASQDQDMCEASSAGASSTRTLAPAAGPCRMPTGGSGASGKAASARQQLPLPSLLQLPQQPQQQQQQQQQQQRPSARTAEASKKQSSPLSLQLSLQQQQQSSRGAKGQGDKLQQLVMLVASVASVLRGLEFVKTAKTMEGPHGWSIVAKLSAKESSRKEVALQAARDELLRAAKEECAGVCVLGQKAEPFLSTPVGFATSVGVVLDFNTACWSMINQGFCRRGCACRFQHPAHQSTINVMVQVETGT